MKKDNTAWIVGIAVLCAFILLIGAWICFFWIAANNRVADVPLEMQRPVQTAERSLQGEKADGANDVQPQQAVNGTEGLPAQ